MKKLGFGFMRMPLTDPNDQTAIDMPRLEEMVDAFLGAGFTYCDTAWMYHDFMSEPAVGKAVVARHPRDSFTVASKMPVAMIHSHAEGVEIFEKQKEKLGVDFFDYYLVHDMNSVNYEYAKQYDMISYLRAKKEAGEIKSLGFSCHDSAEYLDRVLTECPFFEFVQLQINYLDWESEGIQSRKCYEVCVKHGKPVTVMEPVKGGTLATVPAEVEAMMRKVHPDWSPASWALRFAASLPNVRTVLSGMSTLEQVQENTAFLADMEPLNEAELELLQKAWIVEMGELTAMKRSEVESVKAFLSRQVDIYRPAFGEVVENRPRHCVFFGSTNEVSFLKGDSGNRRFWIVPVGLINPSKDIKDLDDERDQLWAEAIHYYRQGEKLYLPHDLEMQARSVQELFNDGHDDPLVGMIQNYLDTLLPADWDKWTADERRAYFQHHDELSSKGAIRRDKVCAMEICCELLNEKPTDKSKYSARQVSAIMRRIGGWEPVSSMRFSAYGTQKGFRRISEEVPEIDEDDL